MESIAVTGLNDPQLTGTLQDDPAPASPEHPGFWASAGGWKTPEEVGKPLVVRLSSPTPAPLLCFAARDTSGYEVIIFNDDTFEYTTLEGVPVPGPAPVLTELSSTSAIIGGPNVLLKASGTGFSRGAQLTFNGGLEATSVTTLETTINMASATTPGSYPVTVKNPDGQESEPLMFTLTEPVARRGRAAEPEPDPKPDPEPRHRRSS
jgi:hypothetical protein